MPKVSVGKNGIGPALKKFKRKVNDSGVLKEFREKLHYEKPSDKRRRKHKSAIARAQKANGESKQGR